MKKIISGEKLACAQIFNHSFTFEWETNTSFLGLNDYILVLRFNDVVNIIMIIFPCSTVSLFLLDFSNSHIHNPCFTVSHLKSRGNGNTIFYFNFLFGMILYHRLWYNYYY